MGCLPQCQCCEQQQD